MGFPNIVLMTRRVGLDTSLCRCHLMPFDAFGWLFFCSAPHVKARFRQFKQDSAWIVNSILRLYFDPTTGESDESSHISLDGFITAVTLVLTEKT